MSKPSLPRCGLYAITDTENLDARQLLEITEKILKAGVPVLQFRAKTLDRETLHFLGNALVALCQRFGVPLIINDDPALARALGASGVHLGRDDADVSRTRETYPDLLIGVSCYNDIERAILAQKSGADYVAFGAFFPSPTKPGAKTADISLLVNARKRIRLPMVAIGGITPENGGALLSAGADFLAVISGIYAHSEPCARVKNYLSLFNEK